MRDPSGAPLRLLVVDDNTDTAAGLALLFESWGHDVRVAHDGAGAVEAARQFRPDVVLLDIGLPVMDGFTVARHIRALPGAGRPLLIAASGYGRDKDRRRAREVGIDHYLVKPYDVWRLQDLFAGAAPAVSA